MKKLAIVTTHPIQYYAPLFKLLHQREKIIIKVFYTWGQMAENKFDPSFQQNIEWDIPLLTDYNYEWANNVAKDPGSHHFRGIITPGLTTQIESWRPDALLVFGWAYQSHLNVLLTFKKKIPIYFRGDSTLLDVQSSFKTFLKNIFLKWVYKNIDHAFYVGTNNKAYFKKFGLEEKRLSFAPHAIDNKRFEVDRSQEASILRKKLGINERDTVILFAGKFEHKKAPDLLLKVFLKIKKENLHLLMVGSGKLENFLREQAGANANIHFMEFQNQSNMPVIYQASDIYCLPSRGPGETWGLSINEAMACKRAIIASDKCGCAVDLIKNDNGVIFANSNLAELERALYEMTKDRARLSTLGEKSRLIVEDWTLEKIAIAIEKQLNLEGTFTKKREYK